MPYSPTRSVGASFDGFETPIKLAVQDSLALEQSGDPNRAYKDDLEDDYNPHLADEEIAVAKRRIRRKRTNFSLAVLLFTTLLVLALVLTGKNNKTNGRDDNLNVVTTAFPTTSAAPTTSPTTSPAPSVAPSKGPTSAPSISPSSVPTASPAPTPSPTTSPAPSVNPTKEASSPPTSEPSSAPSKPAPSAAPSLTLSKAPTSAPSNLPSSGPAEAPSKAPSNTPSLTLSKAPTSAPSSLPPVEDPTDLPSKAPTTAPSKLPSSPPTSEPSSAPSKPAPSAAPSLTLSKAPTSAPTNSPTSSPTLDYQNTAVYKLLKKKVEDPSLLLDSSTPQGQAFLAVYRQGETDPFLLVQRYALMTIYFSTSGETWTSDFGWKEYAEGTDDVFVFNECDWEGITSCRLLDNGRAAIESINLPNNNLVGAIPPEYCLLDELESLVLRDNDVTGLASCRLRGRLDELEVQGNPNFTVGGLCRGGAASWDVFITDCSVRCTCCTICEDNV